MAAGMAAPVTGDRLRCVALCRLLLAALRERAGVELPASLLAVEALDGGAAEAPALAWAALHEAPAGPPHEVARAVARAAEHGARGGNAATLRGDVAPALWRCGVPWDEAAATVRAAWDGAA